MQTLLRIIKWITLIMMVMAIIIIGFQNITSVQTRFLFYTVELPLAATLAISTCIGFLIGLITSALWRMRSWRAQAAKKADS